MNFIEFTEMVAEDIKKYLPEEYKDAEVRIYKTLKNKQELTGVVIKKPENVVTPTIYLDKAYEDYMDGTSKYEILDNIAQIRIENEVDSADGIIEVIKNWDIAKERIIPSLVGYEENERFLSGKPYKLISDLAAVYRVVIENNESICRTTSCIVTDDILVNWGISKEELHEVAISNIPNVIPSEFKGMSENCKELIIQPGADIDMDFPKEEFMYILSNKDNFYGAANILDKETTLTWIHTILGDCYLLPSSINEWIIIPMHKVDNVTMLKRIVKDVNDKEISPDEILSYSIYMLDKDLEIKKVC